MAISYVGVAIAIRAREKASQTWQVAPIEWMGCLPRKTVGFPAHACCPSRRSGSAERDWTFPPSKPRKISRFPFHSCATLTRSILRSSYRRHARPTPRRRPDWIFSKGPAYVVRARLIGCLPCVHSLICSKYAAFGLVIIHFPLGTHELRPRSPS